MIKKKFYDRPEISAEELQGIVTLCTSSSENDGTIDSVVENDYNWELAQ